MSLLWSYGAAWVDKSGKFTGLPKDKAVQAIKIMPKGPAGRNLALTFVMNWGIPVDGKQQKEARALVACLMSKEKFTTYMTGSFQQAVPLFKSLINHEYWNTP